MTERIYNLGGAVPQGWRVRTALANKGALPDRKVQKALFSNKLLVERGNFMDAADWPIRDQGERGTCNAFAIAAAEELVETNQFNRTPDLSEEYLYALLRKNIFAPLNAAGVNLDEIDQDEIVASGGTFLIGALNAFERHGICEESFAVYDKNMRPVNYALDAIPIGANADAALRRRSRNTLEHDITRDPSTGDGRFWVNNSADFAPSARFAKKLQQGLPVVASFAILSGTGKQAWFSELALRRGVVEYPGDAQAALLQPIGGHTVCLIGVCEAFEGPDNPGYFLFRNSYGTDGFAAEAPTDGLENKKPAPGYGMISVRDVDRYCWEYLTRRDEADGLPQI